MPELIWEGKYDTAGRRVAPLRIALPFQTVETVNESAQERQKSLDLFRTGQELGWRNRLIWGNKKYVLPALLAEFAGKVDLIYIDPPFNTGDDFSMSIQVDGEDFTKEPSIIEQKAYRDTWGKGLESYIAWFYEGALLLRELLAPSGSIYVHLDHHVVHWVKAVMDEIFGPENFRNEVIWKRTFAHGGANRYGPVHDTLLFYSSSEDYKWNAQHTAYSAEYIENFFRFHDEDGRQYRATILTGSGRRSGDSGKPWRGIDPNASGRHWAVPGYLRPLLGDPPPKTVQEALDRLDGMGRVLWPKKAGGGPALKQYIDDLPGTPLQDMWTDIGPVSPQARERVGYPTQKPEALLERIISSSSNPGDLVFDCFVGSGTTAVVAEKLDRRWIASDLGRFAIHTTRKRLLSTAGVNPFVIQNLGKYERQLWQKSEFGENAEPRTQAYRRFILGLYGAQPMEGLLWIHGVRQGRLVHVGTVDAPVTVGDVRQIASEFGKLQGTGEQAPVRKAVDVLGWDFAFEINEVAKQEAARANIDMRFVRIPREVLDKRAVVQGDVQFLELAALSTGIKQDGRQVELTISDFVIPLDDVPEDVQRAVTKWAQWIDYWAIDWDYKDDTFHNTWQSYRTAGAREIELATSHQYETAGRYTVVVKVIDILGNDTTKAIQLEVS